MNRLWNAAKNFARDEEGAALVEYTTLPAVVLGGGHSGTWRFGPHCFKHFKGGLRRNGCRFCHDDDAAGCCRRLLISYRQVLRLRYLLIAQPI